MKNFLLSVLLVLIIFPFINKADEGMWLPLLIDRNYSEMKEMGLKLTPEEIYSINNSSLKDAIVSFGGFCTGEVISDQGLVLTNHHCGYSAIQSHSSVQNDYLKNGFWAESFSEEKPNKGLFVDFIVSIDDVSESIQNFIAKGLSQNEAIDSLIGFKSSSILRSLIS